MSKPAGPFQEAGNVLLLLAIASLLILSAAAAIIHIIWPPKPELIIDATPAQMPACSSTPKIEPAIQVTVSDFRRIA